jgi:predicted lipoprotein with Yx(FWY)xxD motif
MTDRRQGAEVAERDRPMRWALLLGLVATLGTAGFLLAGVNAHGAVRSNATIALRSTKLGPILVNAKGHTLYLFAKDKNGRSACTGACAANWPALITKVKPTAGSGVKATLLGTTVRSDGRKQVTYNHHPLYTFSYDTRTGQTSGEGVDAFGAHWWTVSAKGIAVKAAQSATTTTTTTTAGTTTTRYPYP